MRTIAVAILIAILGPSALAQKYEEPPKSSTVVATPAPEPPPSQSADEDLALRKALEELEGRRLEVNALHLTVKAKDEHIEALEQIIRQQERIIDEWKTAAGSRAGANDIDDKIKASYEASVQAYKDELARVRADRDHQAELKNWYGVGGAALGSLLTYFAMRRR